MGYLFGDGMVFLAFFFVCALRWRSGGMFVHA